MPVCGLLEGLAVVAALGSDDDIGDVGHDLDPAKLAVSCLVGGTVGQAVLTAQLGRDFLEGIAKVAEALGDVKGASSDLCQLFQILAALVVFGHFGFEADAGGESGGSGLAEAGGEKLGGEKARAIR